jgi:hypothetical protein
VTFDDQGEVRYSTIDDLRVSLAKAPELTGLLRVAAEAVASYDPECEAVVLESRHEAVIWLAEMPWFKNVQVLTDELRLGLYPAAEFNIEDSIGDINDSEVLHELSEETGWFGALPRPVSLTERLNGLLTGAQGGSVR